MGGTGLPAGPPPADLDRACPIPTRWRVSRAKPALAVSYAEPSLAQECTSKSARIVSDIKPGNRHPVLFLLKILPKAIDMIRIQSLVSLPVFVAAGLLASATTQAQSAAGTVRSSKDASVLQGVSVSVVGGTGTATTDGNGAFTIQLPTTSLAPRHSSQELGLELSSGRLLVSATSDLPVSARLLTPSGSVLWSGHAVPTNGQASFLPRPVAAFHGIVLLQVSQGSAHTATRLPLEGASFSGNAEAQLFAARSAAYPVLSFKKTGYHDTTYSMTATSQQGIQVSMRDTTSSVGPTTCTLPTGPSAGSGSFTNYWFGQGSWQENGHYALACGYHGQEPSGQNSDVITNIANPGYFVAIPGKTSDDFDKRMMCGACVELSGQNGTKIIATVADECPENSNQPCMNNPNGHLDVSYPAFSKLGFSVGNPSGTTWKYVACPITGNVVVRIKPGNSDQLYVENTILPIKDVLVNGKSSTKLSYGAWQLPRGARGATVTIKDYSDRTITYTIPTTLALDTDQNTGLQFPTCK